MFWTSDLWIFQFIFSSNDNNDLTTGPLFKWHTNDLYLANIFLSKMVYATFPEKKCPMCHRIFKSWDRPLGNRDTAGIFTQKIPTPTWTSIFRVCCYTIKYVVIRMDWKDASPGSRLFAQPFIQAQIKENIKGPRHCPLWRESPAGSPHKGLVTRKSFGADWDNNQRLSPYSAICYWLRLTHWCRGKMGAILQTTF